MTDSHDACSALRCHPVAFHYIEKEISAHHSNMCVSKAAALICIVSLKYVRVKGRCANLV